MNLASHWPPKMAAFFGSHPEWLPSIPSSIPSGWDGVVASALQQLEELKSSSSVDIRLAQVKEKFGGLRMYLTIDEASIEELKTIEDRPGHLRLRGGAAVGSVREQALQITDRAEQVVDMVCVHCGGKAIRRRGVYRLCADHV